MILKKHNFLLIKFYILFNTIFVLGCVKKGPCEGEFNPTNHDFDSSVAFKNQIFHSEFDTITFLLYESLLQRRDTMNADINIGGGADCQVGMEYMMELEDTAGSRIAFIYIGFMRNVTALYNSEIENKTKDFTFRSSVKYRDSEYFIETEADRLQEVNTGFIRTGNNGYLREISFLKGYMHQFIDSSGMLTPHKK
jgi:hypothetical protein